MLLADLGADIVRIDRIPDEDTSSRLEANAVTLSRGRRSIAVDLKRPTGVEIAMALIERSDILVEGFRPGVLERLGLGPEACMARNPKLVYVRCTGWGQDGPLARAAGHDINFAGLVGALHAVGDADRTPPPPLNFLADFAGGGSFLATGALAALYEREHSGCGQVIDVAMVDGTATLTAHFHGMIHLERWTDERANNVIDGAAPFYRCYSTSDDRFMAVGSIEPPFYLRLLSTLGLSPGDWPQHDRERWPALHEELETRFATRTQAQWEATFKNVDACVTPVLSLLEAPEHPHLAARGTFEHSPHGWRPAPAPRFSRTRQEAGALAPEPGEHTRELLDELGFDAAQIDGWIREEIVSGPVEP